MIYDIAIIGGGLAGLTAATLLARKGLKIIVFEKNDYPAHKVCGEYISNETLPFLRETLQIDPFAEGAAPITDFLVTAPSGRQLGFPLDLGGFGISRYRLDFLLYQKALAAGANILTNTALQNIADSPNGKRLITAQAEYEARLVIGAHGKRSTVDHALKRRFFSQSSPYVGVKYHIRTDQHPDQLIALHNFEDGYCGISRIEEGQFCLCYLVHRDQVRKAKNIATLEQTVLSRNPFLKKILMESEKILTTPKTVNEISFRAKNLIDNDILMCGDAAGMIAPLCGNGMSMAIHAAKILSELLILYFDQEISKAQLHHQYETTWRNTFGTRIWVGRNIQHFFGSVRLTEGLLALAERVTLLPATLLQLSHGKPF